MVKVKFALVLTLGLLAGYASQASANSYWNKVYANQDDHFSNGNRPVLRNWNIGHQDRILSGRFLLRTEDTTLVINPGQQYITFKYDRFNQSFFTLNSMNGAGALTHNWPTRANDLYVVGDFNGDLKDEILLANPDGRYETIQATFAATGNLGIWKSLQYASNGDIDAGDKLVAGDFTGNGNDEVMLIKANGNHYVMSFDQSAAKWNIISYDLSGSIHWWVIRAGDSYMAGDYDGDGKDELIALNTNGWHHSMRFVNNQWQYFSGGSNGYLGQWDVSVMDSTYLVGDYNDDGTDEILAINPNGDSHTLNMVQQGQYHFWHTVKDNNNNFLFSQGVSIDPANKYSVLHNLPTPSVMVFNPNGKIRLIEY